MNGPGSLGDAAAALRYWELRQQVATNNLANAETPGFKAERVFARLLGDATVDIGARTDARSGGLRPTGNPLDLALVGDDRFFVVSTPQGERLTRGGGFQLDDRSRIVDTSGNALLGEDGPITVPEGATLAIEQDGTVRANGNRLGRLRIESVGSMDQLEHQAGSLYVARGPTTPIKGPDSGVRQGHLEDSNTNTLDSMVELITIQRAYASVLGGVRTLDGVMDTVVNRIGRVG